MAAARLVVQDRGYGGLSFRDLARDVGIRSASIHHHFPTKAALGAALAERYTRDFSDTLEALLASGADRQTCLETYTDVFGRTLRHGNRMCLAGMMSAEHAELPGEVRIEVAKFGEMNVAWIAKVLSLDRRVDGKAVRRRALALFAAIEGAQLVARSRGDAVVYDTIVERLRAGLRLA